MMNFDIDLIAEDVILSLADMIYELRRLRKENKQLSEDNIEYRKALNEHYSTVGRTSALLLEAVIAGATLQEKSKKEDK